MRKATVAVLAWLGVVGPVTAAEFYKWVDAQGVVHYTTTPPPGQEAKTVKTDPRVPEPVVPVDPEAEAKAEEAAAMAAAEAVRRCAQSRGLIQLIESGVGLSRRNAETGLDEPIGAEEQARLEAQARERIAADCPAA